MISLHLSNPPAAITALLSYLDNFYSDPAGWSLLAELYTDQGLYAQSMTALGHLMLIQSWDSSAVCRAGETAYTMGYVSSTVPQKKSGLADGTARDHQSALKYFLRAAEMQIDPSSPGSAEESRSTRSWWGVKLVSFRLLNFS